MQIPPGSAAAPNLKALMADPKVLKIFHFARFDITMILNTLGVMPQPLYCTRTASRLARTYTDKHGLKDLARELLGVDMSKQQQTSDWGAEQLSDAQLAYAAADVFVFPSRTDTFGLVMIEALACGTPVAAFPVTGPLDVLTPGVGAMHDDLEIAIAAALRKRRAACAAYGGRFSWAASAEQFLAALAPVASADRMAA